jgi:hypothetical protein
MEPMENGSQKMSRVPHTPDDGNHARMTGMTRMTRISRIGRKHPVWTATGLHAYRHTFLWKVSLDATTIPAVTWAIACDEILLVTVTLPHPLQE